MIARKLNQRTIRCCARCNTGIRIHTNVVITPQDNHVQLCDACCKEYHDRRVATLAGECATQRDTVEELLGLADKMTEAQRDKLVAKLAETLGLKET